MIIPASRGHRADVELAGKRLTFIFFNDDVSDEWAEKSLSVTNNVLPH